MLMLNFGSEELKEEFKLKRIYLLVKKLNMAIIFFAILICVFITGSKAFLQSSFNQIVDQTTLITKNSQVYATQLREINLNLDSVAEISNSFYFWSRLLSKLSVAKPDGISLTKISADSKDGALSLSGLSQNRESLLMLKSNMENDGFFSEIDFPLKNILDKGSSAFSIKAKISVDKLKL